MTNTPHPADEYVRSAMEDACTCDTSGNTSTYDGSFAPDESCPVHGRNGEQFFKQFAPLYRDA